MKIENAVGKRFVIDASITVKWFHKEVYTQKAESILSGVRKGAFNIYAPELLIYEVGNALGKGKKFSEIAILTALEALFESGLIILPLDLILSRITVRFMCRYGVTFYDGLYGALAFSLNVPLITADPKDHKKIKEVEIIELAKLSV